MIKCETCGESMDLFEDGREYIFYCRHCEEEVVIPLTPDGQLDYTGLYRRKSIEQVLSDVTRAELQKRVGRMTLSSEPELLVHLESPREIEILSKHLQRDGLRFKTCEETVTIRLGRSELARCYYNLDLPPELRTEITSHLRSPSYVRGILGDVSSFFRYAIFTSAGRLSFSLPNTKQETELRQILKKARVFHFLTDRQVVNLPWNSVILLKAFVEFPLELENQILSFMVGPWLNSRSFYKGIELEKELRQQKGQKSLVKDKSETKAADNRSTGTKPVRKKSLSDFF